MTSPLLPPILRIRVLLRVAGLPSLTAEENSLNPFRMTFSLPFPGIHSTSRKAISGFSLRVYALQASRQQAIRPRKVSQIPDTSLFYTHSSSTEFQGLLRKPPTESYYLLRVPSPLPRDPKWLLFGTLPHAHPNSDVFPPEDPLHNFVADNLLRNS